MLVSREDGQSSDSFEHELDHHVYLEKLNLKVDTSYHPVMSGDKDQQTLNKLE